MVRGSEKEFPGGGLAASRAQSPAKIVSSLNLWHREDFSAPTPPVRQPLFETSEIGNSMPMERRDYFPKRALLGCTRSTVEKGPQSNESYEREEP